MSEAGEGNETVGDGNGAILARPALINMNIEEDPARFR
jgi:hypothetical protein